MHQRTAKQSYALAIHPSTLRILDEAGLSEGLIGAEVLPALRDLSDELGLNSPEEAGVPVSLATTPAEELHPQPRVRDEAASYDPALHT